MEITTAVSSVAYQGTRSHLRVFSLRQIVGSRATALETLLVLRQVISKSRFSNMEQLVTIIRGVGRRLVEAQPKGPDVSTCTIRSLIHGWNRAFRWQYRAQSIAPYTRRISHRYERNSSGIVQRIFDLQICDARAASKKYAHAQGGKQGYFKRERSR